MLNTTHLLIVCKCILSMQFNATVMICQINKLHETNLAVIIGKLQDKLPYIIHCPNIQHGSPVQIPSYFSMTLLNTTLTILCHIIKPHLAGL